MSAEQYLKRIRSLTGSGRMSGVKLDGGVEMMAACLEEENDNEVV